MNGRPHLHRREGFRETEIKAKIFRRKRALTFLRLLYVKQDTLKAQLESNDFQAIRPMIEGE